VNFELLDEKGLILNHISCGTLNLTVNGIQGIGVKVVDIRREPE